MVLDCNIFYLGVIFGVVVLINAKLLSSNTVECKIVGLENAILILTPISSIICLWGNNSLMAEDKAMDSASVVDKPIYGCGFELCN